MDVALASLLPFALVATWWLIGYPFLFLLWRRPPLARMALLAPATGAMVLMLVMFICHQSGLSVGWVARPLGIALTLGGLLSVVGARISVPWRRLVLFAIPVVLAFVLTSRPLMSLGEDWTALTTDDFVNYVSAGEYFEDHSSWYVPSASEIAAGTTHPMGTLALYRYSGTRPGVETLLAWTIAATGRGGFELFMPYITALFLCQMLAISGLVYSSRRRQRAALAAAALIAIAPLSTVAVTFQTLAQEFGLAVLAVWASISLSHRVRRIRWQLVVLQATITASLAVVYPEISPFAVLGFAAWVVTGHRTNGWIQPILLLFLSLLVAVALLNGYVLDFLNFLFGQTGSAGEGFGGQFPFFTLPNGLAAFWGLTSLKGTGGLLGSDVSIAIGIVLTLLLIAVVVRLFRDRDPLAYVAAGLLAAALTFSIRGAQFASFKAALWLSPFALAAMATWLTSIRRPKRAVAFAVTLFLALPVLGIQAGYVRDSERAGLSGTTSVTGRQIAIADEFRAASLIQDGSLAVVLDTKLETLGKLQAIFLTDRSSSVTSGDVFANIRFTTALARRVPGIANGISSDVIAAARSDYMKDAIDLRNGKTTKFFFIRRPVGAAWILTSPTLTAHNSAHVDLFDDRSFTVRSADQVKNFLVFVETEVGQHYDLPESGQISSIGLYAVERDPILNGAVAGIGRYQMFEVVNPSPGARLRLNMTTSFVSNRELALPAADLIGRSRMSIGLVGRGSARVFTDPIDTQRIRDREYLVLDMGRDGEPITTKRTGLANSFRGDVAYDFRRIVASIRDVSLVPAADYEAAERPTEVSRFPDDLRNEALEYSGMYEDGWLSDAAFFRLDAPRPSGQVVVDGFVPDVGKPASPTTLTLLVDGRAAVTQTITIGNFRLVAPVEGVGAHRIDLRTSTPTVLPAPDSRIVTGFLRRIAIE